VAKFDDGLDLTMRPCALELGINQIDFAAYADREGRRGTKVVWVLCEDKHKTSRKYKKGEVQLVACMIAAAQWNFAKLSEVYPEKLVGIRVIGDAFCFYSANIDLSYLKDLAIGFPKNDLHVHKYPKDSIFQTLLKD
ncbi:8407_t:CDS:1, partial [Racocetra fulgida]